MEGKYNSEKSVGVFNNKKEDIHSLNQERFTVPWLLNICFKLSYETFLDLSDESSQNAKTKLPR